MSNHFGRIFYSGLMLPLTTITTKTDFKVPSSTQFLKLTYLDGSRSLSSQIPHLLLLLQLQFHLKFPVAAMLQNVPQKLSKRK